MIRNTSKFNVTSMTSHKGITVTLSDRPEDTALRSRIERLADQHQCSLSSVCRSALVLATQRPELLEGGVLSACLRRSGRAFQRSES